MKSKKEMFALLAEKPCTIDIHTHLGVGVKMYQENVHPCSLGVEDLALRMRLCGIDKAVTFPFSLDDPASGHENERMLTDIYEFFPEYSDMFLPFLFFDPSNEPEKQALKIRLLAEKYPVYGLKTVTSYVKSYVKDILTKGRAILEVAREFGLPFIFHSSISKDDPWANAWDIIEIAGQCPGQNICLAHSARFSRPVFERARELDNCFIDFSAFKIHCDQALEDSAFIADAAERVPGDYSKPSEIMRQLSENYSDTVLWGSDVPGNSFIGKFDNEQGETFILKLKAPYDSEYKILRELPELMQQKIAYENSLKFLKNGRKG